MITAMRGNEDCNDVTTTAPPSKHIQVVESAIAFRQLCNPAEFLGGVLQIVTLQNNIFSVTKNSHMLLKKKKKNCEKNEKIKPGRISSNCKVGNIKHKKP